MAPQTVVIGSDHAGYRLKELLKNALSSKGIEVVDKGTMSTDSCDYPVIAKDVCGEVLERGCPGVLVCGTGIGMSMTANRFAGIRAATCTNDFQVEMTRKHNDCNVMCLGERVTGDGVALRLLDIFLNTDFEGGRHQRRVDLIELD